MIDNAVDEALAGACNHIIVTLHDDGSVEVADNGRGIPVDVEPKTKLTGVEVVLTKLHAGAKSAIPRMALPAVCMASAHPLVNALSSRLDLEVAHTAKPTTWLSIRATPECIPTLIRNTHLPIRHSRRRARIVPPNLIIGKVSPKNHG